MDPKMFYRWTDWGSMKISRKYSLRTPLYLLLHYNPRQENTKGEKVYNYLINWLFDLYVRNLRRQWYIIYLNHKKARKSLLPLGNQPSWCVACSWTSKHSCFPQADTFSFHCISICKTTFIKGKCSRDELNPTKFMHLWSEKCMNKEDNEHKGMLLYL